MHSLQAFNHELSSSQQQCARLEETNTALKAENSELHQALAEREQQIATMGAQQQV